MTARDARANGVFAPRILYLIDEIEAITAGGTERQVLQIIRLMKDAGAQPQLCLLRGGAWLTEETAGCPVTVCGFHSFWHPPSLVRLAKLVRWMRARRFDIVQTFFVEANVIGPWLAKLASVPVVLGSRRNLNYWMSARTARLQAWSNRLTTRLVANCEAVKQTIVEMERTPPEKVDVIYNGVDTRAFAPDPAARALARRGLELADDTVAVGAVASLLPQKGVAEFVQAAAGVLATESKACFLVAGDGPLRAELQQTISQLGIQHACRLLGAQENVRAFLQALDIAVLPSRSEGFSNSILEYLAAGLPCIATSVGGNVELLAGTGILVPPASPAELAVAIRQLVGDAACRQAMADASLRRAQDFDLARTQAVLRDYYTALLLPMKD